MHKINKGDKIMLNKEFWEHFDSLIESSKIIIDRSKNSTHPIFNSLIYPVDYGYLENTSSMDGDGIDVWQGTSNNGFDAIIVTVDTLKKDSEVKLLIGCNEEEKQIIYHFHNNTDYMKGILIRRIS